MLLWNVGQMFNSRDFTKNLSTYQILKYFPETYLFRCQIFDFSEFLTNCFQFSAWTCLSRMRRCWKRYQNLKESPSIPLIIPLIICFYIMTQWAYNLQTWLQRHLYDLWTLQSFYLLFFKEIFKIPKNYLREMCERASPNLISF